jgi:hypothetical protein
MYQHVSLWQGNNFEQMKIMERERKRERERERVEHDVENK